MALTETVICNMALSRIGVSRPITSVGAGTIAEWADTTIEERVCALWYERCRNRMLEAHPWPFARAYVALVLNDDGTGEVWTDEWEYAYTYPSDCLKVRRFVNDLSSGYYGYGHEPIGRFGGTGAWTKAWRYVIRQHSAGTVILTDVEEDDADIEYTKLTTDVLLFPATFTEALGWLLAAEVAIPLSASTERSDHARVMYGRTIQQAIASNMNEDHPRDEGDGEFIRSRGGD